MLVDGVEWRGKGPVAADVEVEGGDWLRFSRVSKAFVCDCSRVGRVISTI